MHCGISKWSLRSRVRQCWPVLCSRPLVLSSGTTTSFEPHTLWGDSVQHGGLVLGPQSAHRRSLSRCLRRKIHRSVSVRDVFVPCVSSDGDVCEEVLWGQQNWPGTVCVLPPVSPDPAENPGPGHEPVSSGDYNQRHGAAAARAWTQSHVLTHAQRAGENSVWHYVVQVQHESLLLYCIRVGVLNLIFLTQLFAPVAQW